VKRTALHETPIENEVKLQHPESPSEFWILNSEFWILDSGF
jgi:hypothetical protein